MSTQHWTDEELQAHLDEWDALYQAHSPIDLAYVQYPTSSPENTQQILKWEGNDIELVGDQIRKVNQWFRAHAAQSPFANHIHEEKP